MQVIDWELSKKLAGNNSDHAKEFLLLLSQDLPKQLKEMTHHFNHQNIEQVQKDLHYLLGALSYSGALRLKEATRDFYNALKSNDGKAEFVCFKNEVDLFLQEVNLSLSLRGVTK